MRWLAQRLKALLMLPVALLIILVVLLVRPAGLFGRPEVKRV
mgnify:CR=1 FL=1